MQTSVLRTIREYPSAVVTLQDTEQFIVGPVPKPKLLEAEHSKWHDKLCSDMVVLLIHEAPLLSAVAAKTTEFVTMSYDFTTTSADRWIKLLPDKNSHVGVHSVILRIKFTDPDYSAV